MKYGGYDRGLFFLTFLLVVLGLVVIADASAPTALREFSDKYYFVKEQAVSAAIGIVGMIVFARIKYSYWEKLATPLFFVSLIVLVLVLVPGFGYKVYGARRWISLGPLSFQPSEFLKLALAIYLAKVAAKNKAIWSFYAPLVVVAALVMLQPDLGTTIILMAIGFFQMFISGAKILDLVVTSAVGLLGSFLLIVASSYRRQRLMTFLEETSDPLGSGYHMKQVLLALGSGGLFGVGLGQSRQKFLFLPETATDSIFAVIAEEVGFIGVTVLLAILAYYVFRLGKIANLAPDNFSRILAFGIVAWIASQIILNIGSNVALFPFTGIPLVFISYGGSSLISVLLSIGIMLNISKHAKS